MGYVELKMTPTDSSHLAFSALTEDLPTNLWLPTTSTLINAYKYIVLAVPVKSLTKMADNSAAFQLAIHSAIISS